MLTLSAAPVVREAAGSPAAAAAPAGVAMLDRFGVQGGY